MPDWEYILFSFQIQFRGTLQLGSDGRWQEFFNACYCCKLLHYLVLFNVLFCTVLYCKTKFYFQLDQGGLNLPTRDNYLNKTAHKKVLEAYLDYMTRICVLLGANKTEAKTQMSKVIDFESELANITTPSEDRRDEEGLYHPYTIRQWQKEVPFLNWTMFFNDAFKQVNRTVSTYFEVF